VKENLFEKKMIILFPLIIFSLILLKKMFGETVNEIALYSLIAINIYIYSKLMSRIREIHEKLNNLVKKEKLN